MSAPYENTATPVSGRDRRPVWIRGAFMLFFVLAFYLAQTLMAVIAALQFLSMLIVGSPNRFVAEFGQSLGTWLNQTARFQSSASEDKPFPWAPWPKA